MVKPIFIVSLPRAGSTLLQRLLMGHPSIDSCGEPWLVLPLVYMLEQEGVLADYGHRSAVCSMRQFVDGLPSGEEDFWRHAGTFLSALYSGRASSSATHFVDKTPRYYKILKQLRSIYPAAPIILLLRNPLSVYASMLNFVKGDLRYMPMWRSDWREGHDRIASALSVDENSYHVVRYESLLSETDASMSRLMQALGLSYDSRQSEQLSAQRLERGDPTGVHQYKQVDTSPLSSWKISIDTLTKKRMALHWLQELPEQVWKTLGYDKERTIAELQNHTPSKPWSPRESSAYLMGRLYFGSGLHLFRRLIKKNSNGHRPFYN